MHTSSSNYSTITVLREVDPAQSLSPGILASARIGAEHKQAEKCQICTYSTHHPASKTILIAPHPTRNSSRSRSKGGVRARPEAAQFTPDTSFRLQPFNRPIRGQPGVRQKNLTEVLLVRRETREKILYMSPNLHQHKHLSCYLAIF